MMEQQALIEVERLPKKTESQKALERRHPESWIDDLVGALTDPIIVWPSGWNDDLPEWVRGDMAMHRLVSLMEGNKTGVFLASDLEVMVYMYALTLERPIGHEWSNIYVYVGERAMRFQKREWPEDLRVKELSRDETRMLNELKHWLYEARRKAGKERRRDAKRQEAVEVKAEMKSLMQPLFDWDSVETDGARPATASVPG